MPPPTKPKVNVYVLVSSESVSKNTRADATMCEFIARKGLLIVFPKYRVETLVVHVSVVNSHAPGRVAVPLTVPLSPLLIPKPTRPQSDANVAPTHT